MKSQAKYTVIADDNMVKTDLSQDEAIATAYATAKKHPGQVFVSWSRASDGQRGFLNQDGNHSVTGYPYVNHDLPTYRFEGYNTAALYGFGTGAEAEKYCAHLNRGRGTNCWQAEEITDPAELAEVTVRDDVFMIEESLAAIESE
jgi:hypothetical protein